MFLRNAWYCAGWSDGLSQGANALLVRRIAGESIVLYRKPSGEVVALEDRCRHRQAPLSLGRKEGDALRCMYHGWKFGPDGMCIEVPGQPRVVQQAFVRSFPVIEKNDWIWVWMGDPALASEELICHSVGPNHPEWDLRTAHIEVNTNYRLEIANLTDLSHVAWVHQDTFGGTTAYSAIRAKQTVTARGLNQEFWVRGVPAPTFAKHLFPEEARFDLHFNVTFTVPCNFILHFRVFTAGKAADGPSDGQLLLDTFSSQAVTPRDGESVDYYYSWGAQRGTTAPGLIELLIESNHAAFLEDKRILEGQFQRMKELPDYRMCDYHQDSGPAKMLWVLDKLLKEEAENVA
ncbi:aromatic ring-hydroxylating dioxygenase subunit alpha [Azohydromonas lata]|uniref:Aromatic ring-hydroxylating dioxygenase subunit alpha n=1 Tax=Azohydromonas lata TaxID=45677 RepID=A0ABU5IMI5_9BURK|nr:aromatic ring-hydroxylating dioxygenase subunit alpha [Azohydromonas lata]MDZ5460099.1 aromatic ring-hydroxylating dioxygenase subunit alpha [Azohydromonas lata]